PVAAKAYCKSSCIYEQTAHAHKETADINILLPFPSHLLNPPLNIYKRQMPPANSNSPQPE
ncbi:hypothetical protein L9F63_009747, partial [Diploptera punctata]